RREHIAGNNVGLIERERPGRRIRKISIIVLRHIGRRGVGAVKVVWSEIGGHGSRGVIERPVGDQTRRVAHGALIVVEYSNLLWRWVETTADKARRPDDCGHADQKQKYKKCAHGADLPLLRARAKRSDARRADGR